MPTADPLSLIKAIRERKMKVGVAISPDTHSTAITDEVALAADMLLVMTVYPGQLWRYPSRYKVLPSELMTTLGRGGQKFLERCVTKVAELRARFPDKDIEVDGGVGPKTINACADAGNYLMTPHISAILIVTRRK
jgi:ribulose-phosphate 3-epimerase